MLPDNTPVTLLTWIDGRTIADDEITADDFRNFGKMIAEMQTFFTKETEQAPKYKRSTFDQTMLPVIIQRIEKATSLTLLTKEQSQIIYNAIKEVHLRLNELDNIHEKQIVHADLGKGNVIVGLDGRITPIDFGHCGYGHFYMDIGAYIYQPFHYNIKERDWIMEGYKSVRDCEINIRYIELYNAFIIILTLATADYEKAKGGDWFPPNLINQCCREILKPFTEKISFISGIL